MLITRVTVSQLESVVLITRQSVGICSVNNESDSQSVGICSVIN